MSGSKKVGRKPKARHADPELVATMLVEAVYSTDDMVCGRYGIVVRTLQRYRQQLATDPELSAIVASKKLAIDARWADELPNLLRKCTETLTECMESVKSDPKAKTDANVIHALAGVYKICSEVQLTGRVIDARYADTNRPQDGVPRQVATQASIERVN